MISSTAIFRSWTVKKIQRLHSILVVYRLFWRIVSSTVMSRSWTMKKYSSCLHCLCCLLVVLKNCFFYGHVQAVVYEENSYVAYIKSLVNRWFWRMVSSVVMSKRWTMRKIQLLGSFQCQGVLLLWHMVGQRPAVLAAGVGWVGYVLYFF